MRFADCTWMMLDEYLEHDDRVVLPLGSTEQHAFLSVATDSILAERLAVEACDPLGVPVLPVLSFGVTPWFATFPGSPSLSVETLARVIAELAMSLRGQGFGRLMVINSHGGNQPVKDSVVGDGVAWFDCFDGRRLLEAIEEVGEPGGHASWTENFPWTRLPSVAVPTTVKKPVAVSRDLEPGVIREMLGDGSFGGPYAVADDHMLRLWDASVADAREAVESGWASRECVTG